MVLLSTIGLCCDETYRARTNFNDGDDDGDDDGNEDVNDDDNADSRSVSDGPIFNLITTPWSHVGGLGNDDGDGAAAVAHYISTHWIIYLPYKDPIKDVPSTNV